MGWAVAFVFAPAGAFARLDAMASGAGLPEGGMIERDVVKTFWNGRAQHADDPRSVTLDKESAASVAREVRLYQSWMFRRLAARNPSPEHVVDLGCGNGDWTVVLAERAGRVTAVDFAEKFLEHCRRRAACLGPAANVRFVQTDATEFEFEEPCDLVVAGAVVQYLDDSDAQALLERARAALCARGGTLYLRTTVAKNADRRETMTDSFQGIYRSKEWYREVLEASGFRIEEWALATDFVADELGRKWLGPAGPMVGWPLRLIRRAYRSRRPTDVFACIASVAGEGGN